MKDTIVKLFLSALAYFSDLQPMVYAVLAFVFIDLLTGLYASWILKIPIQSSRLRKTVEKFVFYIIAIVCANVLEKEFLDFANIDRIVAAFIALTEVKSIFENITKITGLKIFDAIWHLIKNQYKQSRNEKH